MAWVAMASRISVPSVRVPMLVLTSWLIMCSACAHAFLYKLFVHVLCCATACSCVIDRVPRNFDAESCMMLTNLAEMVVREIEKDKQVRPSQCCCGMNHT